MLCLTLLILRQWGAQSTYKEYHSVGPLVGIGALPTPLSPASVPLPPKPGGGGQTRLRVRGWGSPYSDDWRKSLALCLLCGGEWLRNWKGDLKNLIIQNRCLGIVSTWNILKKLTKFSGMRTFNICIHFGLALIPGRIPGNVGVLPIHPEDPGGEEVLWVTWQVLVAHHKCHRPGRRHVGKWSLTKRPNTDICVHFF